MVDTTTATCPAWCVGCNPADPASEEWDAAHQSHPARLVTGEFGAWTVTVTREQFYDSRGHVEPEQVALRVIMNDFEDREATAYLEVREVAQLVQILIDTLENVTAARTREVG